MRVDAVEGGCVLAVRVQPNASKNVWQGWSEERACFLVRVKAPPVDGAANRVLCRFVAKKVLRVPPSSISVVTGHSGRSKRLRVEGLSEHQVLQRLA